MYSVTGRIQSIKQPRGGYLPVKSFEIDVLQDENTLLDGESLSPGLIGTAVDYLTRFMCGADSKNAFNISILGAKLINDEKYALTLVNKIKGLDDKSIYTACQIVGYDVVFRAGSSGYKEVRDIKATEVDITNVRTMVNRSLAFIEKYGPIVLDGFTFEGGYTRIVSSGDGDYLTADTLWDFKVSKNKPTSKHTLQILMYYIMGLHSINNNYFESLQYLGIFNPRLNTVYRVYINNIPQAVLDEVTYSVIGYGNYDGETEYGDEASREYSVKEVAQRYGVSENKIRKDCFDLGLPHYKKGNKYLIDSMELLKWEIETVYIPIGRNDRFILPGYLIYMDCLEEELIEARKSGNKELVKKIKAEIKSRKIVNNTKTSFLIIFLIIFIVMAGALLLYLLVI
jgi:hypothetical protein